ncbi:aldehyde dehydrogenase family protein [Spiribacter halobius]|nr:aldehyde dehydrogenase family protein [Spiribacter halobius]UEX77936.1 aldehyde dehydrogenase family protein [Spiribacter halobius]
MEALPVHTHYIGGQWQEPRAAATAIVRNPATEVAVGEVCLASGDQVARACQAAAEALSGGSATQEEIFGPVLCVLGAESDEHATELANATRYGLAASVWSTNPERAENAARSLVAGQVDINGARFNTRAPFGGFRDSGFGRELGAYGVEEYVELRAVQHPT